MADGSDMLKMQEEAKRRVMQMRDRSRFFMQDIRSQKEGEGYFPQKQPTESQVRIANTEDTSGSDRNSAEDTDKLLLLSLFLLLQQEHADRDIALALLYIIGFE